MARGTMVGTGVGAQVALPMPTTVVMPYQISSSAKKAGGGILLVAAAIVGGYFVVKGMGGKATGLSGTTISGAGLTGSVTAPSIGTTTATTAAAWSVISITPGTVAVGQPLSATVLLQNTSGQLDASQLSGVIVDPDGKVAGHFTAVTSGSVASGSTAPLVMRSEGNLATIYAGKSIRLGFDANSSLASAVIGAPAPSATYVTVDVPAVQAPALSVNPAPTQPVVKAIQSTPAQQSPSVVATPQPAATPQPVTANQLVQTGLNNSNPYVSQLAKTYLNPTVTSPLTSTYTQQAQGAGVSNLVSQYNSLGTQITQLRALVGLQTQTGLQLQPITINGKTYTSATAAWDALAAQQSQIDIDINNAVASKQAQTQTQSSSPSQPSPTQAVSAGTVLQPYGGGGATVIASAPTQVQTSPPSSYKGSTTFTPTTSGGVFIHGINGTGFYAPPGSSAYNAMMGGG